LTLLDLSRWQFATTVMFHMTFPAITVGLAIFLCLQGEGAVRTVPLHREELRQAALDCLTAWQGESQQLGAGAIAVAWTREWIEMLGTLVGDLEEPAANVAAGAAAPWWR
jgi:hypothetical protein